MSLFRHKHASEESATEPDAPMSPQPSNEVTTAEAEVEAPTPTPPVEEPPAVTPVRFDQMFDEWMQFPFAGWKSEVVTVERSDTDNALVVRASMPGLDPVKDVELTVSDGVLWIDGAHREEQRTEDDGQIRHEVRYGSFSRSILLPDGVTAKDIKAKSNGGVLEIRIPGPTKVDADKVPITSSN